MCGVFAFVLLVVPLLAGGVVSSASAGEAIDMMWESVTPPPKPELKAVTLDPARTALLILDIEELTCNAERRPRCLDTVPRIAELAAAARKAGAPVVYSLTGRGTPETILPPVAMQPGELVVQSSVDKFWRTDLEKILADKNVNTVVVTGTAAHGAVMHTATAAGFRGMHVILPVDCLSAADPYIEQASVHLLLTGPGTRKRITLTRSDMIGFK